MNMQVSRAPATSQQQPCHVPLDLGDRPPTDSSRAAGGVHQGVREHLRGRHAGSTSTQAASPR